LGFETADLTAKKKKTKTKMGRKIEPGDLILSPLAKPFPRKKEA